MNTDLHIGIDLKKRTDGSYAIAGITIDDGTPGQAVEVKEKPPQPYASLSWLKNVSVEEAQYIAKLCGTEAGFVREKANDLFNYCTYKGKKYKDYRLFLINAVKKDKPTGNRHINL